MVREGEEIVKVRTLFSPVSIIELLLDASGGQ